ncbi:hypothetical protein JTB14_034377 [Gonioctena quinquepunctata]|nr:hypothetical protein JTB14_034377 [Gonioctena quinquepunctata]
MIDIQNVRDFEEQIGENCSKEEYDSIVHHIEFKCIQVQIKAIEYDYRTRRLEAIFELFVDTMEEGEYTPSILIEEYETEYKIAEFDFFVENNGRREGKALTTGNAESTDDKPPLLKPNEELSKMSAHNLDGIYDDSSMDKSNMEVGSSETTPNRNRIERAGTSKASKGKQEKPNMKEYLEKRAEGDAAKRTSSVTVESPHIESDHDHLSSIESKEESEQESERFRETEKILEEIAEDKKLAQNLLKSTQAGPAGRSYELPAKPNEGEKEVGEKTLKKGENRSRKRTFQTQSKRGI